MEKPPFEFRNNQIMPWNGPDTGQARPIPPLLSSPAALENHDSHSLIVSKHPTVMKKIIWVDPLQPQGFENACQAHYPPRSKSESRDQGAEAKSERKLYVPNPDLSGQLPSAASFHCLFRPV